MGGVQIVSTVIAAAITAVAIFFVVRAVRAMFKIVRQGRPDPTRSGDRGTRTHRDDAARDARPRS